MTAAKGRTAVHFRVAHVVDDMEDHLWAAKEYTDTLAARGLILFGRKTTEYDDFVPAPDFEAVVAHLGIRESVFRAARQLLGTVWDQRDVRTLHEVLFGTYRSDELHDVCAVPTSAMKSRQQARAQGGRRGVGP